MIGRDSDRATVRALAWISCILPMVAGNASAGPPARGAPSGMLPVPAGCFTMGQDQGGEQDEHPAHRVCVSGFLLDRTEVTNRDYERCERAGVCPRRRRFGERFSHPDQPAVGVSWFGAEAYCGWVGKRLPTEAEWEYAARGPDSRRFPWGDEPPDRTRASFGWQQNGPHPVGSFPAGAGPFGHLDLAGNVWEWVADVYHPGYYRVSPTQDPKGGTCDEALEFLAELRRKGLRGFTGSNPIPTECERVLRGGAWNYRAEGLRSCNRVHHPPRFRIKVAGFRCAADAPPPGSDDPGTDHHPAGGSGAR